MTDQTPPTAPTPPAGTPPRKLTRSSTDRVLGGVCGGLGAYLGVDPIIVRVVAVVLAFFGGAGLLFYLAAWLLVPSDDPSAGSSSPGRAATIAGVVVLVIGLGTLLPFRGHWGWGFGSGLLWLVGLGVIGLVVWRLASGERATGSGAEVVRRAGLGLAILAASLILAIGGAWAAAAGGATVVAIIVIAAGVALIGGAFAGGAARWLIVPALALALPAGVVAAADLDVKGGVGERVYRLTYAEGLRAKYRVGVGRLVLDLRDTAFLPRDYHTRVEAGVGQVVVLVPRSVCVSSRAHVGVGAVEVFQRESGGIDVNWDDPHVAFRRTPRLIIDGDIGIGDFQIGEQERTDSGHGPFDSGDALVGTNSECAHG